jgi:hypothetical protein
MMVRICEVGRCRREAHRLQLEMNTAWCKEMLVRWYMWYTSVALGWVTDGYWIYSAGSNLVSLGAVWGFHYSWCLVGLRAIFLTVSLGAVWGFHYSLRAILLTDFDRYECIALGVSTSR